ncbi:hypothetical protein GQE99_06520 [Maritimibacter sp. DP07]|uniref:DNA primase/polymerase bifunctional N-terminal domain-containing protein n=1 Tax=Maritimibacter harenae TaxID=2606218 RepID=A0A845M5D2_9RHOB|nr:bifunctional DNA primase/polymerase [Maritimibacter harenae]MZR12673.1 hypothetical protein [Maritimibacter harenae]
MNTFSTYAKRYLEAGYSPIPIMPGTKRPGFLRAGQNGGFPRWQQFCEAQMGADQVHDLGLDHIEAGIGLALGYNNVVAIDIDIEDDIIRPVIDQIVPESPFVKRGAKGFTAFFRTENPMRAQKFKLRFAEDGSLERENGKPQPVVEILAHGSQTVIPPTIHPTANQPYVWLDEDEGILSMCPAHMLPVLPEDFPARMADALRVYGHDESARRYKTGDYEKSSGESRVLEFMREMNEEALASLDMWVPHLHRVEIDPQHHGEGYRIIASWRGGDGYNIGIHPSGIQDFTGKDGNNGGMTAIDIVVLMNELPPADASSWLFDHLNPGLDEVIDDFVERLGRETEERRQREQEEWDKVRAQMMEDHIREQRDEAERRRVEAELEAQRQAELRRQEEEDRRAIEQAEAKRAAHAEVLAAAQRQAELEAFDEVEAENIQQEVKSSLDMFIESMRSAETSLTMPDVIDASTGMFRDIVEYLNSTSDRPSDVVSSVAALGVIASLFGRRYGSVRRGGLNTGLTHPNPMLIATADSGYGKTSTMETAMKLYRAGVMQAFDDPDVRDALVVEVENEETGDMERKDGTEHMIGQVLAVMTEVDFKSKGGILNWLRARPLTTVIVDEFADVMSAIVTNKSAPSSSDNARLFKLLTGAADDKMTAIAYADKNRNMADVIKPHVAVCALSTPSAFKTSVPEKLFTDGFMGRFVLLQETEEKPLRDEIIERTDLRQKIIAQIAAVVKDRLMDKEDLLCDGGYTGSETEPRFVHVYRTPEAETALKAYRLKFDELRAQAERAENPIAAYWNRALEHVQRLALMHALGRDWRRPVVTEVDLEFARRMVLISAAEVDKLMEASAPESPQRKLTNRAVKKIAKEGGEVEFRTLYRSLSISKAEAMQLMIELQQEGIATLHQRNGKEFCTLIQKP